MGSRLLGWPALNRGSQAPAVLIAGSALDLFHREELLSLAFRSGILRLTMGARDLEAMEHVNEKHAY
jgi:hypothetical protein